MALSVGEEFVWTTLYHVQRRENTLLVVAGVGKEETCMYLALILVS
jgi:hypothetical protein